MTLSFSTKFPKGSGKLEGTPTRFVEKTLEGFNVKQLTSFFEWNEKVDELEQMDFFDFDFLSNDPNPKIHTIRKYKKLRWKPGMPIHFKIWTGLPYKSPTFNFAPIIPCIGVEKIEIKWYCGKSIVDVYIGVECIGRVVFNAENKKSGFLLVDVKGRNDIPLLSMNDGFDSIVDFFEWFNDDFDGYIIHWTNFKYKPSLVEQLGVKEPTEQEMFELMQNQKR